MKNGLKHIKEVQLKSHQYGSSVQHTTKNNGYDAYNCWDRLFHMVENKKYI